jgi:hypothetical protein
MTDQRLRDLVRHQRGPLHGAGLITDEEYAALAEDHGAVARLEGYDALRAAAAETPRHLRVALSNAQRAFERDDLGALATINEDIQGLVDAAVAYARRRAKT